MREMATPRKRQKNHIRRDADSYSVEEREHWIAMAAKEGMNEEKWEDALRCYTCFTVEKVLTREPWEVCAMCEVDWRNVRYLLQVQAGPIADFCQSRAPGPLHQLSHHKCRQQTRYDPTRGKYPTQGEWRKAWRGQSRFPPFIHLALYCTDIWELWAEAAAARVLTRGGGAVVADVRHQLTIAHDRGQCGHVWNALSKLLGNNSIPAMAVGFLKNSPAFICSTCFCHFCGRSMRGEQFLTCGCIKKGHQFAFCYDCYAHAPWKSDKHHCGPCVQKAIQASSQGARIPPNPEHQSEPFPLSLLLNLPAETCGRIAMYVLEAHRKDLPISQNVKKSANQMPNVW